MQVDLGKSRLRGRQGENGLTAERNTITWDSQAFQKWKTTMQQLLFE